MKKLFAYLALLTAVFAATPYAQAKLVIYDNGSTTYTESDGVGVNAWNRSGVVTKEKMTCVATNSNLMWAYVVNDACVNIEFYKYTDASNKGNTTQSTENLAHGYFYKGGGWKGEGQIRDLYVTTDYTFNVTIGGTTTGMTLQDDNTYRAVIDVKGGESTFKIVDNKNWFGFTANTIITNTSLTASPYYTTNGTSTVNLKKGNYTVVFDPSNATATQRIRFIVNRLEDVQQSTVLKWSDGNATFCTLTNVEGTDNWTGTFTYSDAGTPRFYVAYNDGNSTVNYSGDYWFLSGAQGPATCNTSGSNLALSGLNGKNLKVEWNATSKSLKIYESTSIPVVPAVVSENGGDWSVLSQAPAVYLMADYLNNNRVVPDWELRRQADGTYRIDNATLRNVGDRNYTVRVYYSEDNYVDKTFSPSISGLETWTSMNLGRDYTITVKVDGSTISDFSVVQTSTIPAFMSFVGYAYQQSTKYTTPNNGVNSYKGNTDRGWQESWILYDESGNPVFDRNNHVIYSTQWPPRNEIVFTGRYVLDGSTQETEIPSSNLTFKRDVVGNESEMYLTAEEWKGVLNDPILYGRLFKDNNGNDISVPNRKYVRYYIDNAWVLGATKIWTGWGSRTATGGDGKQYSLWDNHANWGYADKKAGDTDGTEIDTYTTYALGLDVADSKNSGNFMFSKPTNFRSVELFIPVTITDGVASVDMEAAKGGVLFYTTPYLADARIEARTSDKNPLQGRYQPSYVTPEGMTVTGYTITRYVYGMQENGEVVYSTDNITDENSLEGNTSWKYEDKVLENGRYYYTLTLKVQAGEAETMVTAVSNPFTILSTEFKPLVESVQLVDIHANAADDPDVPEELKQYAGMSLTYRSISRENNFNYYVVDRATHHATYIDKETSTKLRTFLVEHPEHFTWTADRYVSGFRGDDYRALINKLISQGSVAEGTEVAPKVYLKKITKEQYEAPSTVTFTDDDLLEAETHGPGVAASGGMYPIGRIFFERGYLGETYYASKIVYHVDVTDGEDLVSNEVIAVGKHTPNLAMPYDLSYSFPTGDPIVIDFDDETVEEDSWWPHRKYVTLTPNSSFTEKPVDLKYYMDSTEDPDAFNVRTLNCVFSFMRPNFQKSIFDNYKVVYGVKIESIIDEDKAPVGFKGIDFGGDDHIAYFVDPMASENPDKEFIPNRKYSFILDNVHPSPFVHPMFRIVSVKFIPTKEGEGNMGNQWSTGALDATYPYGTYKVEGNLDDPADNYLCVFATNTANVPAPTIESLTVAPGARLANGKYNWYYKGHTDMKQGDSEFDPDNGNDGYRATAQLYMVESMMTDAGATYQYTVPTIWSHKVGHTEDPYLTWMIGENYPSDKADNLEVRITPLHFFYRMPQSDVSNEVLIESDEQGNVVANAAMRAAADARVVASNVKASDIAVVRGNYYSSASDGTSFETTGIEDVLYNSVDADAEYYNIQGMRIANPVVGEVYIVRRGNVVTKEIVVK